MNVSGPDDGTPLLLISGLGGTAAFWSPVKDILATRHRVVCYDQPGCGVRPTEQGPVTVARLAQDALAIASSVFGSRPITVIGHSTGGVIAQHLTVLEPELVARLVLSGTWLQSDTYMDALFGYRKEILLRAPELASGLTALLSISPGDVGPNALKPQPMSPDAAANAMQRIDALLDFDGTSLVPHLQVPVLVLGACDDRIIPFGRQEALHAALSDSTLQLSAKGGHFFPKTEPADFAQRIEDWFEDMRA